MIQPISLDSDVRVARPPHKHTVQKDAGEGNNFQNQQVWEYSMDWPWRASKKQTKKTPRSIYLEDGMLDIVIKNIHMRAFIWLVAETVDMRLQTTL